MPTIPQAEVFQLGKEIKVDYDLLYRYRGGKIKITLKLMSGGTLEAGLIITEKSTGQHTIFAIGDDKLEGFSIERI